MCERERERNTTLQQQLAAVSTVSCYRNVISKKIQNKKKRRYSMADDLISSEPWYKNEAKWKEFLVTHKVTAANLAGMKEAFCLYDKDRDGLIDSGELAICMRSLGQSPTQAEVIDMANEIDANGDGMIDFYEFVMLMARQMRDVDTTEAIVEAFKIFDLGTIVFVIFHALNN